jgi:mannosyltransferase
MSIPVQERPTRFVPPAPATRRAPQWPAIAVPAALAAALVFYGITSRSLGFDEGATVSIASQHGAALWAAIAHDGGNMSGYYLLLHVLIGAFGNGLFVLRVVSALSIVATVALIAAIGRRLFDPLVALVAGVLAAVSLPLVYWGQTARGYAPMCAFVCAGFLAFIELCDPPDGERPGRWPWVGYVAAMTLAMYFSFVAALVIPAQLLVVVGRRGVWRRVGSAVGAVVICSVPLAVLAVRRGSGQLFWVTRPTRMTESQVLQSLTSGGLAPSFHHTGTTYLLMWGTVAAVVALMADVTWRAWRRREAIWGMALVLSWCVVPAAITFVYSFVSQPIFVPRNVLMSTPAVALALAVPVRDRRRLVAAAASLAVVAVVVLRALQVGASYGVSPEPWDKVTLHVLAQARPGDCVTFYPLDARMAFQYYVGTNPAAERRAPRSILPIVPWGTVKPYVERYVTLGRSQIAARARGCRRMWLVSSHEGQVSGPAQSQANRVAYFRMAAELESMFGFAPVHSYGYASTIHVALMGPRPRARAQGRSVKP